MTYHFEVMAKKLSFIYYISKCYKNLQFFGHNFKMVSLIELNPSPELHKEILRSMVSPIELISSP